MNRTNAQTQAQSRTIPVTALPVCPDKVMVQRRDGGFTVMSISRFISYMIAVIREEVKPL